MTHYNPYDWEDLEEFGIAQHFEVLGWNNVSWVSTDMNMIPESDFMDFDQLSLEQQIAAVNLCFLPEIWDGDSLTSRWVDNYSTVSGRVEETTEAPSASPSSSPSSSPSQSPSSSPSSGPTGAPSGLPSDLPSMVPSSIPSDFPSSIPSDVPSMVPSSIPSDVPSSIPSDVPSMVPSDFPTGEPTLGAKFGAKKKDSASSGGIEISVLDEQESYLQSDYPSSIPSDVPSNIPSDVPSMIPSDIPSMIPSDMPSMVPSSLPSDYPSLVPSSWSEEDSEGKVDAEPSPAPSVFIHDFMAIPTSDPSAGPSLECKDDTTWTYTNGNGVTRSCVDVGANPERFCALDWAGNVPDTRTISEACALTCGTCLNSTSDSDGEYQGLRRRS